MTRASPETIALLGEWGLFFAIRRALRVATARRPWPAVFDVAALLFALFLRGPVWS